MENNLRGKRLLLLGGNLWKDTIRQFADEQGITLVATSNDPNAGFFDIAEETYLVSSTDAEAMKNLIREKKIDGVYLGGSEPVISAACQYLKELDMPCYCTKEQWDYLQNKLNFKEICASCGLPVVPQYEIDEANFEESAAAMPYPVITKPVDGCGSNGFAVCHNAGELREGYENAKQASGSGKVIIEKYVKNDSLLAFYTLSDGKPVFSGLGNKYPVHYERVGSYVVGLVLFESKLVHTFREQFDHKIADMLQKTGLKEGFLWMEVFLDEGSFYFNEAGYRMDGTVSVYPVQYFHNINNVAADIYYALTGKSDLADCTSRLVKKGEKKNYAVYALHADPGVIESVQGLEEIRALSNVIAVPVAKRLGDTIPDSGTIAQIYAYVHFTYQDLRELQDMIQKILDTIKVISTDGRNLVHPMIDLNRVK